MEKILGMRPYYSVTARPLPAFRGRGPNQANLWAIGFIQEIPCHRHPGASNGALREVAPTGGAVDYARHFVLLICTAVILAATSRWRQSPGVIASFGLYGAVHSSVLVVTLRTPQSLATKLLFIAIAASCSMLSVSVGFYGRHFTGILPGMVGSAAFLALSSGLGAASYALLVREFWIDELPLRAIVPITLVCMLTTLMALLSGIHLRTLGGLWFAVSWWFAFSAALWYHDGMSRRHDG